MCNLPRFLARLSATRESNDPSFGSTEESLKRRRGGGDLNRGWYLRSGQDQKAKAIELEKEIPTPTSSSSEESLAARSSKDIPWLAAAALAPQEIPGNFLGSRTHRVGSNVATMKPPTRLRSLSSLVWFFNITPFARLPFGFATPLRTIQLVVVLAFLTLLSLATALKSIPGPAKLDSGYGQDFLRTGWVAMVQIPVVVALGVRSNFLGLLVGQGYDKLKVFHKIVGRVIFFASTLHVGFFREVFTVLYPS